MPREDDIGPDALARITRAALQELIAKLEGHRWRETGLVREAALPILERAWNAPKALPVSAIVCLAVLGEPVRDDALAAQIGVELVRDSDRGEHSNWGWPLNAIEPFDPPPPARGAQGFWMWDAE